MKYRHLIFDFDGILVESNAIRFEGFQLLFKDYPEEQTGRLIQYARLNGGMSRYQMIRYFFENIQNELISDGTVKTLARRYSELVKQKIIDAEPVKGSLEFLSRYYRDYDFAIVSGSDQEELREICRARKIDNFFVEILGSPLDKESNLSKLLSERDWKRESCAFVGDSINDFDAARPFGITFIGRNSGLVDWGLVDNVTAIDDLTQLYACLV